MIRKIDIEGIGTYENKIEIEPTGINYFYGSNGSGKTTLSKLIENPKEYPKCKINWEDESIQTVVYNKNFVDKNFLQSDTIKGIFTLGKDTKEAKEIINNKRKEIEKIESKVKGYKKTLEKKKQEDLDKKEEIKNKCWGMKLKYDNVFKEVFKGSIGSKDKFFKKCITQEDNSYALLSEDELKEKYNKIFNKLLNKYKELDEIKYDKIEEFESNHILSLNIVGREDIDIGKLIKSLNNSDWVKQGISFLDNSNGYCPFCQQKIETNFKSQIENFFDEEYSEKCKELNIFKDEYYSYIESLISYLQGIEKLDIKIIDTSKLNEKLKLIDSKLKNNLNIIDEKINNPSRVISLDSMIADFDEIETILLEYINKIQENNRIVENIVEERKTLCNQVWKFIYTQLETDIVNYKRFEEGISKAKVSLEKSKKIGEEKIKNLNLDIERKESEITSVKYTVNEINKILGLFGFNNFKLDEAEEKGFYKIVRPNGEDAKQTLSEGEYTFITFLYFYQLIKGSTDKTGIVKDRIVVIDDPISSLDSNILFIVSTLVKEIINDYREKKNGIKQVFILTHNVYFHKEVTFKGSGKSNTDEESFWIVRKVNEKSIIEQYEGNPIQTTYELLWAEINRTEINTATIFNTLRRILEYYFNILGGMKYEDCINKFEGEDKYVCKSLISWINDGSHFISEEIEMPVDKDYVEKYLRVFRLIFKNMGHEEHYNMMMNKCGYYKKKKV